LGHDLLELPLLLISEAILFAVALVARVVLVGVVVLVTVVILVGGVKLLPLGAVDDEVDGVTTLEAAPG
jgi:hypothetical protein